MREPNEKFDKIEPQEITPTLRKKRGEREHGRVYRWLDNFWYHHKWKTLLCLFLAVVILVCTLQMCKKEDAGDISLILAGPYGFTDNENGYTALRRCLGTYLPEDFDGDGTRRTDLVTYTLYSKDQILALQNHVDENGEADPITVNTANNSQEYSRYNDYVKTGESSIAFLDPWLFDEMVAKGEFLAELEETLGALPEGAIQTEQGDCLGVRLGDTKLYQNNAAMRVLPEDTVLCLIGPFFMGKSADETEYQKAIDYFAALVGIE